MEDSFIDADPVQIEQVLLNLGINARDAMPDTGGTIEIAISNTSDSAPPQTHGPHVGNYVVISVRDNGRGISEDDRHRVFEAFYTTKGEGKGTGLGLSTAQDIVQDHGGWIEFDSEVGKGSEFRVYLPRVDAVEQLTETSPPSSTLAPAAPPSETAFLSGQRRTVLVVDDEAPVRAIATNMLGFLGYEVVEASNGKQALEIMASGNRRVDAILLDIYMPKLSGRDTFQQLRASGDETPVVVCSGFVIDPDEFVVLSQGGTPPTDIMVKPYTLDGLRKAMSTALDPTPPTRSKKEIPALAS